MSADQTENKTKDEILEKLKDIENKIDCQKKETFASGEDQLFFGVIISLLVLFVTLPISDMTSFLQSVFAVNQGVALTNAGYLKYLGIVFFLVSSLTRYCAVISNQNLSRKLRFVSFEALWLGLNIVIFTVTINLVTTLSLQIGLLGLSVTFFVLTLIFVGMFLLERYILKVYAKKELVLKEYFPFASVVLLSIMLGICVALIAEVIALASGFVFSTTRFLLVYAITTVIVILITLSKLRFEKKEATRKRENTEESTVSEVIIKKAEKKELHMDSLIAEYKVLNEYVWRRENNFLLSNSIMISATLLAVTFAIENRDKLGMNVLFNIPNAGFVPIIGIVLISALYFLWLTSSALDGICLDRIHEVESILHIEGTHYVWEKAKSRVWFKPRRYLWHPIFLLFLGIYGYTAIWLFGQPL